MIREDKHSPGRQASLIGTGITPNLGNKRRVGRPKKNWTITSVKKAWKTLQSKTEPGTLTKNFRENSKHIQHWIRDAAELRILM